MATRAQPPFAAHYDVHGIVRISVVGSQTPVGRTIHDDLSRFPCDAGEADLTLVLGEAPDSWGRQSIALGCDLHLDAARAELVVGTGNRPLTDAAHLRYVVRGDTRRGDAVTVHVPRLRREHSRWTRMRQAFFEGRFPSRVRQQANEILTGILEPFLYYRLPLKGHSLVHGAGIAGSGGGAGAILFGGSNVGKTLLSLRLVEQGSGFLGDDLLILDANGTLRSYPKRVNLERHDLATHPGLVDRLGRGLSAIERLALARHVRRGSQDPFHSEFRPAVSDMIDDARVRDSCELRTVVHVLRGAKDAVELREVDSSSCARAVAANLFWEFNTHAWRLPEVHYSFAYGADRDFLVEELEHHGRVNAILSSALARARAFELRMPPRYTKEHVDDAVASVGSLL